jgi:hypothetical protein
LVIDSPSPRKVLQLREVLLPVLVFVDDRFRGGRDSDQGSGSVERGGGYGTALANTLGYQSHGTSAPL